MTLPSPDQPGWTRPPVFVWVGLGVVLLAAAVLSFDALRELAVHVRVNPAIAWLFPVSVDAGAAVSCTVWLGRRTAEDAAKYAGRLTWCLLAVTVAGNATGQGMAAAGIVPPWWVAVLVGAVPPVVVGATVHLLTLMVRHRRKVVLQEQQPSEGLHSVPGLRADRDRLATRWMAENPDDGARKLAAFLTEQGHPLSPSGAQSAYITPAKSVG